MARGYRAAILPLSHTSLHFCKSLGNVRSFFQLLWVSIKIIADFSMESGATVRKKPGATVEPPPHGFSRGKGEAWQRAGAPSAVPGALWSRRPSRWAAGSHLHPMNTKGLLLLQSPIQHAPVWLLLPFHWKPALLEEGGEKRGWGNLQLRAGRCSAA